MAVGLSLQLLPVTGTEALIALLLSFLLLAVFALRNVRLPGLPLIAAGLVLNLTVITANQGMPVSRRALVASGQAQTLAQLSREPRQKHHLGSEEDVLLPLGDVIPIGPPIGQVISVGDVLMYAGVGWFVVATMRRCRRGARRPEDQR